MIPTQVFSLEPTKNPKTGQVSFQNGPNSCQTAQIETFGGEISAHGGLKVTPPLKRFYLQNLDGRIAQGPEKEILAATGLSRQLFYQLRTGKTEYAKHWRIMYYEDNGHRKSIQLQGSKRKYILFAREKGRVLKGTRMDFVRQSGLKQNLIYSKIRQRLQINGWIYFNHH
jgi:hypothetical protein